MRESLPCCSTHATPANGASTGSWSLHSNHEQVADRITDEVNQWFWIDAQKEDDRCDKTE